MPFGYNAAMTPIRGLFETHLPVRDVARSVAFYCDIVGLRLAYDLPERNAAFLWVGEPGQAMLGLWGAGSSPLSMKLHIAFDVAAEDVLAAPAALMACGVEMRAFSDSVGRQQPRRAGGPDLRAAVRAGEEEVDRRGHGHTRTP